MRRLLLAIPVLWSLASGRCEIIDRIAVSVDNRAITESEINLNIRLTAFLNNGEPDFSPASRRAAAARLVEQLLVRSELELSRYPVPPKSEAEPVLKGFMQRRFQGSEAAFQTALQHYGLTREQLLNHFWWQTTFLRFVDVRFRPGVQVTEEEIQTYFEETVKPLAEKTHPGQKITLEEYRDQIEDALMGRKTDEEVERWLQRARRRADIEYREAAFQ